MTYLTNQDKAQERQKRLSIHSMLSIHLRDNTRFFSNPSYSRHKYYTRHKMRESVKSTRFWKSKVITLFSAKSTDFHKAITLLLINVQKWFWYRWNCPLTFSADCRLSCTCDEHISKHIDIEVNTPTYAPT